MSVAREEFHYLVDGLREEHVGPVLALVRESLPEQGGATDPGWPLPEFVGALSSGKGDLAERSEDILRDELGRRGT